ncbi:MAG: nuclear transport factor 2 family protein [Pseudomonadota bacterium]
MFAVQDPAFVGFSLAPPLRTVGLDADGVQAWFDTWIGGIDYHPAEQTVVVGGDIAYAHGLVRMGGTKTDGQADALWFRHTLGFQRRPDGWKIVHEHQSTPFYMDGSLKAAVDLIP